MFKIKNGYICSKKKAYFLDNNDVHVNNKFNIEIKIKQSPKKFLNVVRKYIDNYLRFHMERQYCGRKIK